MIRVAISAVVRPMTPARATGSRNRPRRRMILRARLSESVRSPRCEAILISSCCTKIMSEPAPTEGAAAIAGRISPGTIWPMVGPPAGKLLEVGMVNILTADEPSCAARPTDVPPPSTPRTLSPVEMSGPREPKRAMSHPWVEG